MEGSSWKVKWEEIKRLLESSKGSSWKVKSEEIKRLLESSRAKTVRGYAGVLLTGFIGAGGSLATTDIIKKYWNDEVPTNKRLDELKIRNNVLRGRILLLKQDLSSFRSNIENMYEDVEKHDKEIGMYLDNLERALQQRRQPPPPLPPSPPPAAEE